MQNTLLDPTALLDEEQRAWLQATLDRNRSKFGGWSMEKDDDSDNDDDSDDGDSDDHDDDSDNDGDDDKGEDQDNDKVDWKAKFEAEQRHKRNLERKARKDAATIARLTGKKPAGGSKGDDDKVDAERIREEAKAEARREALADRVADKIEAKAAKFADPEDAVAVLLRSHDIDDFLDDDKVDVEAITDALKELGEKKPHLLAQGGKKFQGSADGGARKDAPPARPKDLGEALARHYDKR